MITITVRYHNTLRRITGSEQERITLPNGSLVGALASIADRHGPSMHAVLFSAAGDISTHIIIFCNQQLVPQGERERLLVDGDELMLFQAISGGAGSRQGGRTRWTQR
jgi:molybdopterin converting factor small subunit